MFFFFLGGGGGEGGGSFGGSQGGGKEGGGGGGGEAGRYLEGSQGMWKQDGFKTMVTFQLRNNITESWPTCDCRSCDEGSCWTCIGLLVTVIPSAATKEVFLCTAFPNAFCIATAVVLIPTTFMNKFHRLPTLICPSGITEFT